jgi:two-component sensor histidine kinase
MDELHKNEEQQVLKQLHHRVKNNLQVICSLLRLQSHYISEESTRAMFKESEQRVRSLAMIHERFCNTADQSAVQFDEYAEDLVNELVKSYCHGHKDVTKDLHLEKVRLPIEQAVPCGLVLNELVTNALKYGQPDEGALYLGVTLRSSENVIELKVVDRGPGIGRGVNFEAPETLGLRVVQALTRQLGATLSVETTNGTEIGVRFAVPECVPLPGEFEHAPPQYSRV